MKTKRAITLIELLIVVAIIAILSAASLAVVTAPMADERRAHAEASLNTGFGLFHASLVGDLHDAREVHIADDGRAIEVVMPAGAGEVVRYALDEAGTLRRTRGDSAAVALMPNVTAIAFAADGPFVSFDVAARLEGWDRDMRLHRSGRIAAGIFGGGAQP